MTWVINILNGVAFGMVLFLIAAGLSLIYGLMRVLNLTHGSFYLVRRIYRPNGDANPLWGAPRIHCELRKLGIEVRQTTVAKYMAKRRRPPSQGWKTFFTITPMASPQWTCLSCRRSHSGFCMRS